jgi:hypothetical protein
MRVGRAAAAAVRAEPHLHHQADVICCFEGCKEGDNVGVVQAFHDGHFLVEEALRGGLFQARAQDALDGNLGPVLALPEKDYPAGSSSKAEGGWAGRNRILRAGWEKAYGLFSPSAKEPLPRLLSRL